ncbi:MAG TPA: CBS domain-containing protein [Phycisphaerae bacterium]|nr:CBS domain-containing protein [Phycisphaerae bacterium]HOJ75420.1 CBS domain-containing protein [Phycisphaerae bacterium]HOM49629.1 CBS domain-containing protein [Phycisphaerae bacterium]HON65406.1 CBS domain-containing protein [Phycisphaerae bacterium]HOQ84114.1 CBS domain-containing protein [Phycisphaerae bacterium]
MRCTACGYQNFDNLGLCEACEEPLDATGGCDADRDIGRLISNEPLSALHPAPAVTVPPTTPVAQAIRMLAERNIGCLLVTSGDALLGIFSERDALQRIGPNYYELIDRPISDFMTPDPVTLTPEDSIAFALNRMDINDFRHIPVRNPDGTLGIISVRDCLAYVTRHFPELKSHTN